MREDILVDKPIRVLVVDDEPSITEFVSFNLKKEGYTVDVAYDGNSALGLFKEKAYDIVILDVMLPGMNGYEVCKHIREISSVPVLFLSARDTELDKVVGLEIGGDDYLSKPFGIRELHARLKALLRRSPATSTAPSLGKQLISGGITLNEDMHTASAASGEIELTPREFELLSCLMKNNGRVLSREQLLREAWGWEFLVETKTVDTHVKRLRDKLESAGLDPSLVETVRGYGYRFKTE